MSILFFIRILSCSFSSDNAENTIAQFYLYYLILQCEYTVIPKNNGI